MRVRRSLRLVETTVGAARVHLASPGGASGAPLVALGHGAGGGVDSWDLQQVAAACIDAGCRVALIEQPWRVAGRRIAPRPATLDAAWVEVLASFRPAGPLVVGGRSAGARVACRTAGRVGAAGVLALAFPLHPPARPGVSRERELADASCPVLTIRRPSGLTDPPPPVDK